MSKYKTPRPKHKLSSYIGEHVGGRAHPLKGAVTLPGEVELALARAWPKLQRQNRVVLYLTIIKGMTTKAIAELLGVSKKTVKEHRWQARQRSGATSYAQSYALHAIRFYQEYSKPQPLNLRQTNVSAFKSVSPLNSGLGADGEQPDNSQQSEKGERGAGQIRELSDDEGDAWETFSEPA